MSTDVTAGNVGDAQPAAAMIADVSALASANDGGDSVEAHGDSSYGTAELVEPLEQAGVEATAPPARECSRKMGLRLSPPDFSVSECVAFTGAVWLLDERARELEDCIRASSRFAVDGDRARVRFDDAAHEQQAEAETARRARAAAVDAEERSKELPETRSGDHRRRAGAPGTVAINEERQLL